MLLLKSKDGSTGNGILYGGLTMSEQLDPTYRDPITQTNVYFVETDFGNHMKLTWAELTEIFTIDGVRDYEKWKRDRSNLQERPNLIEQTKDTWSMPAHAASFHSRG